MGHFQFTTVHVKLLSEIKKLHFLDFLSENLYLSIVASFKMIIIYAEETKKESSQYVLLFQRENDNIPSYCCSLS